MTAPQLPARTWHAIRAVVAAAVLTTMTACAGAAPAGTPASSRPTDATTVSPEPMAEDPETAGSPPTVAAEEPAPPADTSEDQAAETPEESFRAWLAASRAPDPATACGYMTQALVDRMVAEMTAQGWPGISDCESMITTTAELYAALGDVANPEISVREERSDATVLFVAYDGSDCGAAVMEPAGSRWIINDQTQEEC